MKRSIKGRIRTVIRQCKTLDYIFNCIIKYKDIDTVDYVRGISLNTFKFNGVRKRDCINSIVYYIHTGNNYSGFGAEFRRTLDGLYFADKYGFMPFIEYNKTYIYSEEEPINGTDNPFEYYFNQPIKIDKDFMKELNYITFNENHRNLIENDFKIKPPYEVNEQYLSELGKIVKKYIHINSETSEYIESSLKNIGFKDCVTTIGVHYRGTDFSEGRKRHPKMVGLCNYLTAVDDLISKIDNKDYIIFLATDDGKAIDAFKEKYYDKVVFFKDTYRSSDGEPVHFSSVNRKHHKYTLGLEILRDMIVLSKCNYLISGLSQVSFCARIFKYSRNEKFKDMLILDNGIN